MKHANRPSEIWNAHSLYCTKLSEEFKVIKDYLIEYSSEVVIIHLKGGWNEMNEKLYKTLNEELEM